MSRVTLASSRLVDVVVAPATVVPTSRDRQQSAEHSNPPYLRQVSDHTGGKPIARAKALGLKVTHQRHWLCTAAMVFRPIKVPVSADTMPSLSLGEDMQRREFITLLGSAAVMPVVARAQQPAMPIVGFVSPRSPDESARLGAAFRKALNETGYI